MMIRSQNKKSLYPLTHGLYYDSGVSIMMDLGFSDDGTGDLPLGKYASESRCLDVLDEIHSMFCESDSPCVYQMPKE